MCPSIDGLKQKRNINCNAIVLDSYEKNRRTKSQIGAAGPCGFGSSVDLVPGTKSTEPNPQQHNCSADKAYAPLKNQNSAGKGRVISIESFR
jgi:hypothetical protein